MSRLFVRVFTHRSVTRGILLPQDAPVAHAPQPFLRKPPTESHSFLVASDQGGLSTRLGR